MAASMTMESDESTCFDLLYPDLLSKEGLLHTLKKRYVQISCTELESLDKESLVDLYNQYILPLPQRKYRDNLRGREMKRNQILKDKKRRFVLNDDGDTVSLQKNQRLSQESPSAPSKGLINQFSSSNVVGNRLKPPPSCIDTSKKVVKLSSSSSPAVNKEEFDKKSPVAADNKTITLKVDNESKDGVKRSASQENQADESSPKKKKISKITWP